MIKAKHIDLVSSKSTAAKQFLYPAMGVFLPGAPSPSNSLGIPEIVWSRSKKAFGSGGSKAWDKVLMTWDPLDQEKTGSDKSIGL